MSSITNVDADQARCFSTSLNQDDAPCPPMNTPFGNETTVQAKSIVTPSVANNFDQARCFSTGLNHEDTPFTAQAHSTLTNLAPTFQLMTFGDTAAETSSARKKRQIHCS
jgi:hypothetical protein